jgi:UDP-N-acetylglucosamine 2-epimerase (non-hydrolysing)
MATPARDDELVDIVIGTRPEVIKLAPVVRELRRCGVTTRIVLTGQHEELVESMLGPLDLADVPTAHLQVMRPGQGLNALAAQLLSQLDALYDVTTPSLVLVQGDTTSALCAALAAFHRGVAIGHVEAGLRSHNMTNPFPEEMNRVVLSRLASWHFCPTARAARDLAYEGVRPESVEVTGNTGIDTLVRLADSGSGNSAFDADDPGVKVLVTLHRRESQGERMRALGQVMADVAAELALHVVLPIHPNPCVREALLGAFDGSPWVRIIEPLGYLDFVATLRAADIVVTDSGGVQEEAPSLNTATLVVRDTTERPEAVEVGASRLIGTDPEDLRRHLHELAVSPAARLAMTGHGNPYGDGHAAERIVARLLADRPELARKHNTVGVPG